MEMGTGLSEWDEVVVETPAIRKLIEKKGKIGTCAYIPNLPLEVLRVLRPLGATAAIVGLLVWREARIERRLEGLRLSGTTLQAVGLSRFAFYRALERLEEADLIGVTRRRGSRPVLSVRGVLVPQFSERVR